MLIGNPKLDTPLMQSRQTAGLDLPLRVLVWQDEGEVTHVGYTPPAVIVARYDIPDRSDVVEKMTGALAAITDEATARSAAISTLTASAATLTSNAAVEVTARQGADAAYHRSEED